MVAGDIAVGAGVLSIRPGLSGDHPAVRALVAAAYERYIPSLGEPPRPMRDDYAKRIAAGQVWVLEGQGGVVGLVVIEDHPGFALLDNVAVNPSAQGQGLGRRLLGFVEDEARRRGYGELRLYTNARMVENIAMYRHLGFVEIDRVEEQGFGRVSMAKRLTEESGREERAKTSG